MSGFGLRVMQKKKIFQARRKRNGKNIRVTIGEYPLMNLKQAKEKAYKVLYNIENSINPNEQRREHENKSVTLAAVFKAYFSSKSIKEKTVRVQSIKCNSIIALVMLSFIVLKYIVSVVSLCFYLRPVAIKFKNCHKLRLKIAGG